MKEPKKNPRIKDENKNTLPDNEEKKDSRKADFYNRRRNHILSDDEMQHLQEVFHSNLVEYELKKRKHIEMNINKVVHAEEQDGKPVGPPDPEHYRFVKTIEIHAVLKKIKRYKEPMIPPEPEPWVAMKLFLETEPEGPNGVNTIAVKTPYNYHVERLLGYLPPEDAEKLGPEIRKGKIYVAWIKSYVYNTSYEHTDDDKIVIDVYERLTVPLSGILKIHHGYVGFLDTASSDFTLSIQKKTFVFQNSSTSSEEVYHRKEIHFSPEYWEKHILPVLEKCNFNAWLNRYTPYHCGFVSDEGRTFVEFLMEDKHIRTVSCCNRAYPEELNIFEKLIKKCIGLEPGKELGFIVDVKYIQKSQPENSNFDSIESLNFWEESYFPEWLRDYMKRKIRMKPEDEE